MATVTVTVAPVVDPAESGIDLGWIDPNIRPQDDLFGYLTGRWLAEHQIPGDRSGDTAFRALRDLSDQQIRDLITELGQTASAEGTDARRIGDLFASYLDTDTIDKLGLAPLLDELDHIDTAADRDALATVMGSLARTWVSGGFGAWVGADAKDSSRNALQFYQSGLGLPDEAYYRDPQYAAILAAYPGHIANMFALTYGGSADDYAETAARIVALETRLAAVQWDSVKNRDAELTYNPVQFDELVASAPGFDWTGWLTAYGITPAQAGQVIVAQPDYLTAFAHAWATEPLEDWQDWARWRVIHERATLLTEDLGNEDFAFYDTVLSGTEQRDERWKRAVGITNDLMGQAVGRLWVEQYFPPEAKQRMETMVANLLAAYRVSIDELDWMSAETRAKALEKLDKITVKIGYPDQWKDYSGLEIVRDDLYGNYLRGAEFGTIQMLAKLGQPVDRSEWDDTPQTVNAYYDPSKNEIVFPAGILQAPFFDLEADDAANYGAIGGIIGHEIGHAFDDQGSKYDGDGNLVNWWTDADRAEFTRRANALIAQYNQYSPRQLPDTYHVNGALTIGENIGDQGGLAIALKAYQISLGSQPAPVIDGYTGVQRVFLGWTQAWRAKYRDAEVIQRLATDSHSPAEFRVNGVVRNLDSFYEAFGVGASDALYLPPEERVRIWT
ncbi:MAG: M13-type metalloendopeptidase [Mycobacterium sp.]